MKAIGTVSPERDDAAVEESLQLIDEKIATYERSILQLKSRRNELAPPSRLPHEVLGSIFAFVVATNRYIITPGCVGFSYVCRLWRHVALRTPSIWCFIPLRNTQLATAALERSRLAGLCLSLEWPASAMVSQFTKNTLENHASRIRDLSFRLVPPSTMSTLLQDVRPSSFRLRSLQLSGRYNSCPIFPASVVADCEGLRNLDVVCCQMAWWSMPLTGLTSLRMVSTDIRPLWPDFIASLAAMPSLETLELRDSLPLADELRRRTSNPIQLSKLQQLDLASTADLNEVTNILASIVVPQAAIIKFGGHPHPAGSACLSNFFSSVSTFISETISENKSPVCYYSLVVDSALLQFTLRAWTKPDQRRKANPADLDLMITRQAVLDVPLPDIAERLPLSKLESLSLNFNAGPITLQECFGDLQHLRKVTLHGPVTRNFLEMLMVQAKGHDQKSYYKVTCPALQTLEIFSAIFSPDHGEGLTFEDLEDCLIDRCNRHADLSSLLLVDCFHLYELGVDRLREIVVDVDWDEHVEEFRSEGDEELMYEDDDEYDDMYSSDYYDVWPFP